MGSNPRRFDSVRLSLHLDTRTEVYDAEFVKGAEFLRKARRVARSKNLIYRWVPSHGKGSHGTLYVGVDGITIVQNLKREIPAGTLRAMIEQFELEAKDFGLR